MGLVPRAIPSFQQPHSVNTLSEGGVPSSQGSGRKGSALDSYLHFSCRLELEIVTFLEDFLEMVLGETCQSVASELQALAAARSPTLLQNPGGGGEEGDKWETGAGFEPESQLSQPPFVQAGQTASVAAGSAMKCPSVG